MQCIDLLLLKPLISFKLKLLSNVNLLAARGCSGKLKRLREHEVNYQQEHQTRQERNPNNGGKLNGIVASGDESLVDATAKVSAAAAEIIHGGPTMGQGSRNPTSPIVQTAITSHDAPSYQIMRYLAQQSNILSYPNTNMLSPLLPSHFDLGSFPQEESLWWMVQQHCLLASAALFPSLTNQAPTGVLAEVFQDVTGTNIHLNNNAGLSLASTLSPNIFRSAETIASAGLVGIAPSRLAAAHANITANSLLISAGLGLSTNHSMHTRSNLNAHTSSTEGCERNEQDNANEEYPPRGSQ